MFHLTSFFLFTTTLLLGLRHGIDWDHIAAITDITTSSKSKKQSFILGSFYAVGHGLFIVLLGMAAVFLGVKLPEWVDTVMEPVVGITLIFLGIYLAFSVIKFGKNTKIRSRWMLIFAGIQKIYDFIESKITHRHSHSHFHYPDNFDAKTAFIVGVIHGIGAETPTQILLFITAAGSGGSLMGALLVFIFVLGLLLSNTLIIILSILGISSARENKNIYLFLCGITAVFSFIVGILFLTGKGTLLPVIFGG